MVNKIMHSSTLEQCPTCNHKMSINNDKDDNKEEMTCSQCGYYEPNDSIAAVTYISTIISELIKGEGIKEIYINGCQMTPEECTDPTCCLPLFVDRAKEIQNAAGLNNIEGMDIGLKNVADENGITKTRVVMSSNNINYYIATSFLAEVVYETISLNQQLNNKNYLSSQLNLDVMPNLGIYEEMSAVDNISMHAATQRAFRQAAAARSGIKNDNQ